MKLTTLSDPQMSLLCMKSRKRDQFSEVFYYRHRKHILRVIIKASFWLAAPFVAAGACLLSFVQGKGDIVLPSIAIAVLLFFAWAASRSIRDQLRVRVVPYFERRLGTTSRRLSGENLLS